MTATTVVRRAVVDPAPLTATAARHLHAEWTKLRTVPGTWWLLCVAVLVMAGVGAGTVSSVSAEHCQSAAACHEDTVKLSLTGIWLGQAVAAVLGALAMTAEFGTGTVLATFTAMPRRSGVLAAKAVVLAGLTAVAGTAGVLLSLLAGRLILPGNGFTEAAGYPPASLADGPTLRAAAGTVLIMVLVSLLALGLAAMLRDTAGTLTAALALLYLAPLFKTAIPDDRWVHRLDRWAPMPAALSIQATKDLDRLAIAPWPGLGVLAIYAGAALAAGAVVLHARDV
ncbi:ABC transporter permease [Streptomyces sp. NPDC051940]|uniref:ABC transporter permease n=1 Tax=Streptomyces sp. NPDC051940 TaxID=3155675 RepID=UPI00344A7C18